MRDLSELITKTLCLAAMARDEEAPSFEAALVLVTKHLPRLREDLEAGLVTEKEVAGAITDRFVVWMAQRLER